MKFCTFAAAFAVAAMVLAADIANGEDCNKDKWEWENCSQLLWRYSCDGEKGDYIYFDEDLYEEWAVTYEEWVTWKECQ